MAKVDWKKGLYSLGARGKFGKPNQLGEHWLGWTELGDYEPKAGYYQWHYNGFGYYWNRSKFYWNPPHTTEACVARNNIFADGVQAWKALADNEKAYYNNLKYPYAQTGFTRFMSKYLKEH